MSTVCQCNKEKKRNTHLRVKEASWNIASLLSYLRNAVFSPPSLSPASQSSGWIQRLASQFGVFSACKSRQIQAPCGGGGGVAWVALWQAFPQTQELVFLMISPKLLDICPVFLLVFSPIKIFWYYSSRQVMAILCCVAKKAASTAQQPSIHSRTSIPAYGFLKSQEKPNQTKSLKTFVKCLWIPKKLGLWERNPNPRVWI